MRGWAWTDMDMCVGTSDCRLSGLTIPMSVRLSVCLSVLPVQQASASKQARQAQARQRRSKQRSKASKDAMQSYVCCQAMEWTRLREYLVSSPCTEIPCNAMECHAKFQIVSLSLLLLPPCTREGKLEPFRKQLETPENLATYFSMILALLALPVSW